MSHYKLTTKTDIVPNSDFGATPEKSGQKLIQTIPKSHMIRPIILVQQTAQKDSESKMAHKKKDQENYNKMAYLNIPEQMRMLGSSQIRPNLLMAAGVSRNHGSGQKGHSGNMSTIGLKNEIDRRLINCEPNHLLIQKRETAGNTDFKRQQQLQIFEYQKNNSINPVAVKDNSKFKFVTDLEAAQSMPSRQLSINPFTTSKSLSRLSSHIASPVRQSLPLKPLNHPLVCKRLDSEEFDPEETSAKSERSQRQMPEFDDDDYNPFESGNKKKVVRFQTQSSTCEITDTNTDSNQISDQSFITKTYSKAPQTFRQPRDQYRQAKQQNYRNNEMKVLASNNNLNSQERDGYKQRNRSRSFHRQTYQLNIK